MIDKAHFGPYRSPHMRTSTFDLHDKIIGGDLRTRLRAWRSEGLSFEEIAYRLRPDIVVSRSTVTRWCLELGIG